MTFEDKIVLWPILPFGMEDDEDDSNSDSDSSDSKESNNQGSQQDSSKSQNDENEDDDPYKGLSSKELKRILADTDTKLKDAVSERDSAKKTLTEKEREKLDENERLKAEKEDDAKTISELRATNAKLALIGAIRDDARFEWHNPEIVAQQFNSDEVKVKDDGTVEGIAKALARVAKEHDYLLKTKKQEKQEKQEKQQNNGNPTGFQPGQGGASGGGNVDPDKAKLVEMMPALATRM